MADVYSVPPSTYLGKKTAWKIFERLPCSTQQMDITMDWPWVRLLASTGARAHGLVQEGIARVNALRQDDPRNTYIYIYTFRASVWPHFNNQALKIK